MSNSGGTCKSRITDGIRKSAGTLARKWSKASSILVAAIVHAELATLRPFVQGSYLVARASTRLILAARDVDNDGLVMSEYGAFLLGRPAYVKALTGYTSGTREGVGAWVSWQGEAIRRGIEMAKELAEMADAKN